jgi:hypothetical protein
MSVREGIRRLWWMLWPTLSALWIIYVFFRMGITTMGGIKNGGPQVSDAEFFAHMSVPALGPPLLALSLWYAGWWIYAGFQKKEKIPPSHTKN